MNNIVNELKYLWIQLLDCNNIDDDSDFFRLGGNSITVVKLISRIYGLFNIELTFGDINSNSKLIELSQLVLLELDRKKVKPNQQAVNINKDIQTLSENQQAVWFYEQRYPENWTYNMPYVLQLKGALNIEAFRFACKHIIKINHAFRTKFQGCDGKIYQQIVDFESILEKCYLIIDDTQKEQIKERIRIEERSKFNLSKPPLIRFRLLCIEKREFILIITIHHIIFDGWSYDILFRDMSQYYSAYLKHVCYNPSPRLSMLNYVDIEQSYSKSETYEKKIEYWLSYLSGLNLQPIPCNVSDRNTDFNYTEGRYVAFSFNESQINGLRHLMKNKSLFLPLLTIYQIFLSVITKNNDIAVGVPVTLRNTCELEDVVGFLINTIVFRSKLNNGFSFQEMLESNKENFVKCFENKEIPLGTIINRWDENAVENPFFQTMFLYQAKPSDLEFQGVRIKKYKQGYDISRDNLVLEFQEDGEDILGGVYYKTNLFTQSTIKTFIELFLKIVDLCVSNNQILIRELISEDTY